MPVHRVPVSARELESAVEAIQATETITHVVPSGDGALIVITLPKTTAVKARGGRAGVETR